MRGGQDGVTLVPSGDQAHLRGFFSKLCWWPVNTFTQRLAGAYGRRSHARSVLSCAMEAFMLTPRLKALCVSLEITSQNVQENRFLPTEAL